MNEYVLKNMMFFDYRCICVGVYKIWFLIISPFSLFYDGACFNV